jgi:GT2 family glycosyltransferase
MLDGDGDKMHICGLAWREGHGHIVTPRETRPKDVFSPCAAAALYRRDALDEVGGFDEEFFCYYEDIDIGFRLRLAGHRCLLVPDAVAYHIGSLSTGERRHSDFAVYHGHRNMVSTYVKDMPLLLFFLLLPAHITINIITIIWFSLLGQGAIICKAKYDAILVLPRMWKKRSDIKKYSIVSISEIWKVLDKSFLPPLSKLLWKGI